MGTTELTRQPTAPGVDGREEPVALEQILRVIAAAASLGAAAVHTSALSQHSFDVLHAGTFMAMAIFQAFWAYLVLRSTEGRVLLAGAVGHGTIAVLWLITRTTGLPDWLPGAPGAEPAGLKDVAATLLAVAALAAIDLLSRRDVAARRIRATRAGAAVGAFLLAAVVLAGAGSFAAGHEHTPATPLAATAHDH